MPHFKHVSKAVTLSLEDPMVAERVRVVCDFPRGLKRGEVYCYNSVAQVQAFVDG